MKCCLKPQYAQVWGDDTEILVLTLACFGLESFSGVVIYDP